MQVRYKDVRDGETFIYYGAVYTKSRYGNCRYDINIDFQPTDKVIPVKMLLGNVDPMMLQPGELFVCAGEVYIMSIGKKCIRLGPTLWGKAYTLTHWWIVDKPYF